MTPSPRASLAGLRVVVTRRAEQSRRLADLLRDRGAIPVLCPTIRIVPPLTWTPVDDGARRLIEGGFEWVLFTSANAVEHFFRRAEEVGIIGGEGRAEGTGSNAEARRAEGGGAQAERAEAERAEAGTLMHGTRVGAVGRKTGAALAERGVAVDLASEVATAEGLGHALGVGEGTVLLPRAEQVPAALTDLLSANGWTPVPVTVYRTIAAEPTGPGATDVRRGNYDVVTFTSASTVRGFVAAFEVPDALKPGAPDPGAPGQQTKTVACIGPVTAAACDEEGLRADVVAAEQSNEGLIEALVTFLDQNPGPI